jgi:phospholipase/lecithinase/hemolysin
VLGSLLLLPASARGATTFTNLYFLGDSLADTGVFGPADVDALTTLQLVSSYGYDPNRWTEAGGTVWAESFAAALGNTAISRTDGGTNYARGGARSDQLAEQIAQLAADSGGAADPNALYVVWAGGNDLIQGYETAHAVSSIVAAIEQLRSLGATTFLVGNVRDNGPLAPGTGPLASIVPIPPNATEWASEFATELSAALSTLSGVTIFAFDALAFHAPVIADPVGHGFSAGLALCVNDPDCVAGIGVDAHLMFDHVHLTSAGHELLAQGVLDALPACANGRDDDGDGGVDRRGDASGDPDCTALNDTSESSSTPPETGCPATPASGCLNGFATAALFVDERTPGRERLRAALTRGPDVPSDAFGDPTAAGGAAFALCAYDGGGSLVAALDVDRAGERCGERPCWSRLGGADRGFRYRDATGSAAGVRSLVLATGGPARFALAASNREHKGETALAAGIALALSATSSVTLQLHASELACLSAQLDDVTLQDGTQFRAR